MTIVRLGADVVSSSPAAGQFFFIYIYMSAVLSIFIYIYIYIFRENTLGECRINILKIVRRKRGTTGETKK